MVEPTSLHDIIYEKILNNSKRGEMQKKDLLKELSFFRINKELTIRILAELEKKDMIELEKKGGRGRIFLKYGTKTMREM